MKKLNILKVLPDNKGVHRLFKIFIIITGYKWKSSVQSAARNGCSSSSWFRGFIHDIALHLGPQKTRTSSLVPCLPFQRVYMVYKEPFKRGEKAHRLSKVLSNRTLSNFNKEEFPLTKCSSAQIYWDLSVQQLSCTEGSAINIVLHNSTVDIFLSSFTYM